MDRFVNRLNDWIANPWSSIVVTLLVAGWWFLGPMDRLDNFVTFIGFPMLFFLAAGQARQTRDFRLMLKELVHAIPDADDQLADVDQLSDAELKALEERSPRSHAPSGS